MNNEQAWALQAQRCDEEAFTKLVEHYQIPVYNLCFLMLGEPEAAEDAAQETFLKAYQNLARYDLERPFATWLLSIAAHYCIDRLRRRRFSSISIDEDEDDEAPIQIPDRSAADPEAETSRREQSQDLQRLLQRLDPTDRAALILRYWHEASEVEIAQSLSLTVAAVKSRLHRARKALAKLWQEDTPESGAERMPYGSPAF